jgi:hypothetical protein
VRYVTLEDGLRLVQEEHKVLKSDGLDPDGYICFELGKGICYEDGTVIGASWHIALLVLNSMKCTKYYKFWVEDE